MQMRLLFPPDLPAESFGRRTLSKSLHIFQRCRPFEPTVIVAAAAVVVVVVVVKAISRSILRCDSKALNHLRDDVKGFSPILFHHGLNKIHDD